MTDFANHANEYRCWSDQDRRFRFARLVSIINRHALASIAIVIPAKSYDVVFTKQAKRFTGGPYGVAAACCFMEAARVLQPLYPSARIGYVFERGAIGMGDVLKVFKWNHSDPEQKTRLKLLSLEFAGKESAPLQAADILAYELYKHLPRQIGIDAHRPRIENLRTLGDCRLRSWGWLEDQELKKFGIVAAAAAEWHGQGSDRKPKQRKPRRHDRA